MPTPSPRHALSWVPSLYFVQGMQFFVVMLVAGIMFKNMGVPNEQIARWTGFIGLAWALKPLWSPLLEIIASKKKIVVATQCANALVLLLVALGLQTPLFFGLSIALLLVLAYLAATHDIACDGLYMASLDAQQQARYAGWQGAFFNASKFLTLGGLVIWAGHLEQAWGVFDAWSAIFVGLAALLLALALWNAWTLPQGPVATATSTAPTSVAQARQVLVDVLKSFFQKPMIFRALLFILLFRFAEGQVQTIGPLFLLEAREQGGLGLSTQQMGGLYGGLGTGAFLIGSILGGMFAARLGLRRAMFFLLLAMSLPNLVFVMLVQLRPATDQMLVLPALLSQIIPGQISLIAAAIAVEMLTYGFGFVGMILYLMQAVAPGPYPTAHYALGTGVMQLGFILSKTISGDLQTWLGYDSYFTWVLISGLPVFLMLAVIKLPAPAAEPKTSAAAG